MILLYCLNGVVVGHHDDQQSPVDASLYGSGVRIVPYDQPLTTLPLVGTAPIYPQRDTRPYGQPTETPQLLMLFAGQVRFETVIAGITWNSIPVATDRISQLLIGNLAQLAATMTPTDVIDFTQAGVGYQFQASQAADLMTQVNNFVQQCRTVENQCLTDLGSATPTLLTYADVEAKFTGLRARTVKFGKAA
jgi:hypothetical protein